jgi:uncharacterized membrane protein
MARRIARWLGIAALIIGYPLLAHYTNQRKDLHHLGAMVALAPMALLALVLAWRSPQRVLMLGVLALAGCALGLAWPALAQNHGVLYWLQHAGMQCFLFILFGRTLIGGQVPLCTRFARAVHTPARLTPAHEHYARQITLAWTVFFAAMGLTSTALFFMAPLTVWSVFANFLTPLAVVLMFIVEYRVRRWLLPHLPHARMLDAVRAFTSSAGNPPR